MVNDSIMHYLMCKIREVGAFDAVVSGTGDTVKLTENVLLLPSCDGASYSLVASIGRIKKQDLFKLNSTTDGSLRFNIVTLKELSDSEIEAGVSIGELERMFPE